MALLGYLGNFLILYLLCVILYILRLLNHQSIVLYNVVNQAQNENGYLFALNHNIISL